MPHRLRITTIVVGLTLLLVQLDATVLGVAIATIARDLQVEPLALHLTISLYQLTLAVFIPISGWLADRIGSKRLFVNATFMFMIMSIACAITSELTYLFAARAAQGVAGAFLMPVGRLTVIRMAGRRNLVEAMVWVATPAALGIAFGPFLGGVIVHYLSWRWFFLLNLPVRIAVGTLSSFYFCNDKSKSRIPFDFSSFFLLGGAASMLLASLSSFTKFSGSIVLSSVFLSAACFA